MAGETRNSYITVEIFVLKILEKPRR